MIIFLNSILIFLFLTLIFLLYLRNRNHKVYDFRIKLIDASYNYAKNCNFKETFSINTFTNSYDTMLYKFWIPLKPEKWLNSEIYNKFKPFLN